MIPPCPYCGDSENGFFERRQMRGPCEAQYDNNGDHSETFADNIYSIGGKVVRCGKCKKVRKDLEIVGLKVQVKS